MIQTGGFTPLVEGKQKIRGQEERESEFTPERTSMIQQDAWPRAEQNDNTPERKM